MFSEYLRLRDMLRSSGRLDGQKHALTQIVIHVCMRAWHALARVRKLSIIKNFKRSYIKSKFMHDIPSGMLAHTTKFAYQA
jgi:hypothetical protein